MHAGERTAVVDIESFVETPSPGREDIPPSLSTPYLSSDHFTTSIPRPTSVPFSPPSTLPSFLTGSPPSVNRGMGLKKFSNPLTPDTIASVGLPLYLFTVTMVWYLGVTEVLPGVYQTWGHSWLTFQRYLVTLMFLEMMVNWLCIRYVTSSYQHYKTYVQPHPPIRRLEDEGYTTTTATTSGSPVANGNASNAAPPRRSYPYWSWVPCYPCRVVRPPRCHHCPICSVCVLKKDHHCFFAGACVGWRNLRHFVVFNMWAMLSCHYAMLHSILYIYSSLWSSMSCLDILAPLTLLRWLLGYTSGWLVLLMTVELFLAYFVLLTTGFLVQLFQNIAQGLTGFEQGNLKSISIIDSRSLTGKVKAVFGDYYLLNFLVPLHFLFSPEEDPENYPFVKVFRH